jgi:hypothetical protein
VSRDAEKSDLHFFSAGQRLCARPLHFIFDSFFALVSADGIQNRRTAPAGCRAGLTVEKRI